MLEIDERLLRNALKILNLANGAVNKILIERERGMGYYHAEVDWLIDSIEETRLLMSLIKMRLEDQKNED